MGLKNQEKFRRSLRAIKTLFFLITMLFSFLLFSAPILLILADSILPSAILSLSLPPSSLSLQNFYSNLILNYDFRSSLIDIPLLSIVRSAVILCVYCLCDGPKLSHGPYLGITMFCSVGSLIFVSLKASYVVCGISGGGAGGGGGGGFVRPVNLALILSSIVLAVGHIIVSYRTSCRERRKLLIYKIDIEAVNACHKGYSSYNKILQQARAK